MQLHRHVAVLLCLGLWAAPAAGAQPAPDEDLGDLTLEQLVAVQLVSAPSKRPQSAREAPSVVTIVTADEIRRQGYRTLGDVLRTLPGFYVTYDRNYSFVGVRGFGLPGDYNTRILLLLDGVRTNDNIYDAAYIAREFVLDPDLIQRVEVSRGPGASVYGNSAFFAVINVITKQGRDLDGGTVAAEAGSFGTWGGKATYGRRLASGLELAVSGALLDSSGQTLFFPEFAETDGGTVRGGDGEHAARGFASVGYEGWSVEAAYSSRRKSLPTAPFGTIFGDTRASTRDELLLVSAGYQASFGKRFDLTTRLTSGAYDYNGAYPYQMSPSATDVSADFASGRWWGAEATGTLRAGRHTLLLGGEYQRSTRQNQGGGFLISPDYDYDIREQDGRFAFYTQDDLKLGQKVILSLGGRFDHYRDLGSRLNPRLALIISPDAATTVKLLYGRAFRSPNEHELHYYTPNGALKSETIETLEAAVERSLGASARIVGTVFRSAIRELITLDVDEDGALFFHNTDKLDSIGAELALEVRILRGVAGRFSYSLQRLRNESGAASTNSPRHMLKANASVPFAGPHLWASADAQYMSSRITPAGTDSGGFALANLSVLAKRLPGGFEATLGVYNLFDTSYADPASSEHVQAVIPQDGRNFRLQISRAF
ncbi:MAG: TonB-dependent receptor plug domain-containing protein [Solirubrobacterales bacterium]|jgi:iron complex outermembrane receptor protein